MLSLHIACVFNARYLADGQVCMIWKLSIVLETRVIHVSSHISHLSHEAEVVVSVVTHYEPTAQYCHNATQVQPLSQEIGPVRKQTNSAELQ